MASTPNMALGLAADTMPADVTPRANRFGLKVDGFSVWLRSATELGARAGKSSEYGLSVCPAASSVLGKSEKSRLDELVHRVRHATEWASALMFTR